MTLDKMLAEIGNKRMPFKAGLAVACQCVSDSGGEVFDEGESVKLTLKGVEAHCFQPYQDIDLFYYEC
ncbi:hypothetical protein HNW13_018555 [Shewanella sp. BF02_Schw]|uniref:hypothetical protein n=1 Tax=Shewanella sp. BF02_Schw TaxID=394908 RepID=UPI001783B8CC|nr:hypothetical protein [Shewanella sp. BF02_Schw]MBO1897743.1 hypothetical protein [Shewanella sp. BF02_Schw]